MPPLGALDPLFVEAHAGGVRGSTNKQLVAKSNLVGGWKPYEGTDEFLVPVQYLKIYGEKRNMGD